MTRKLLTLAITALLAITLTPTSTAQADDCTYNQAIAGQCTQIVYLEHDQFVAAGHTNGSVSQLVNIDGRTFEAECNHTFAAHQIVCTLGIEIVTATPANQSVLPDRYIDANGNQCTNTRNAQGAIIAIACVAPATGTPVAPVPAFTA